MSEKEIVPQNVVLSKNLYISLYVPKNLSLNSVQSQLKQREKLHLFSSITRYLFTIPNCVCFVMSVGSVKDFSARYFFAVTSSSLCLGQVIVTSSSETFRVDLIPSVKSLKHLQKYVDLLLVCHHDVMAPLSNRDEFQCLDRIRS